jgi:hypothetical protein
MSSFNSDQKETSHKSTKNLPLDTQHLTKSKIKIDLTEVFPSSINDDLLRNDPNKCNVDFCSEGKEAITEEEEISSEYSIKSSLKKRRKTRRRRKAIKKKYYKCEFCNKSYLSYPALYTHKRNKHNIIPIAHKQTIFEKITISPKSRYIKLDSINTNEELRNRVINTYKEKLISFFKDPKCILYKEDFNPDEYPGLIKLRSSSAQSYNEMKELLVNDATIDDTLTMYLLSFVEVTRKDDFIDAVITFCILLRTYLNLIGWDYKRKFVEGGVNINFNYDGAFTRYNDYKDVPDLLNDFISVFIHMDERFYIEKSFLLDITSNFCNWLNVNNLSDFKLVPNVDPRWEN